MLHTLQGELSAASYPCLRSWLCFAFALRCEWSPGCGELRCVALGHEVMGSASATRRAPSGVEAMFDDSRVVKFGGHGHSSLFFQKVRFGSIQRQVPVICRL